MTESKFAECPCGSGKEYPVCCGRYLDGNRVPDTAEALMRSRYTAYVLQRADYLLATWDPSTRPAVLDFDPQDAPVWQGLVVHHCRAGGSTDEIGEVEFSAHFRMAGHDDCMRENSRFVRKAGHWFYVDGVVRRPTAERKVGRNDPCPCGSGKKFKRCCSGKTS